VTETGVLDMPLPDQAARERIATRLGTNFLVEAGAGSGKTTALVGRMVELIATGTATVEEIAAVTFTRKAAGELRERFQGAVEDRLLGVRADPEADPDQRERLERALTEIDRAFIGTIHSFCGRLLRERPLEVGLDPAFEEIPVEEHKVLRRRFWEGYLERLTRDSDPLLEELVRAGVRPSSLFELFEQVVENPDVDFSAASSEPPAMAEVSDVRQELETIVDRGWELMDEVPPARGWDSLQRRIRRLHFEREVTDWKEPADLFEAIATLCKPASSGGHKTTLNRWRDKGMAGALKDRVNAFGHGDTPAQGVVDRWLAHRYGLAVRLAVAGARAFEDHRLRVGKLDFQDLLVLAARLLRSNPDVRRQLGLRYRRLLVDEFQDTDPLQAEIMLLLASDPPDGAGGDEEWRRSVPREGALFVVGDPKQSIYRFRRADIQLYGFVKQRFSAFGETVSLSANFRSRPPIGDLVNDLFAGSDFFPAEETPEQAAFERLATRPPLHPVPAEGVFTYRLDPPGGDKETASGDDAARLATWIRARIDAGERGASDFLVLTRGRRRLAVYARTLEAYGLPVQVTGAGMGVDEEIQELQVLLRCMIDPTNPVAVVATLVGLFFGLDYERMVAHRLDGGAFDARTPGDRGHPDVLDALRRLHGWWRASTLQPADVFVGRLAGELGLLPLAAAGELGTLRAGAILYALDVVRSVALAGDTSLPGAVAALDAALALTEAEAPLEPGRQDALRVMNLHQAKGLEGTVVVLADPTEHRDQRPGLDVTRAGDGSARGYLRVTEGTGRGSMDVARPIDWHRYEETERRFEDAEQVRLLYVAVTRAREELVVARWPEGRGSSAWSALDPWLDQHAEELSLSVDEPVERDDLESAPDAVAQRVEAAATSITAAASPSYRHTSVTTLAKRYDGAGRAVEGVRDGEDQAQLRGYAWGNVVHRALAFAAAGPSDEALRVACRNLLVEHQRPLDDHGEPTESKELIQLIGAVRRSDLWRRSAAAERSFVEIPFAFPGVEVEGEEDAGDPGRDGSVAELEPEATLRQLDLFATGAPSVPEPEMPDPPAGRTREADGEGGAPLTVVEGVIDLAFKEADGWVIADYKTDVGTDPGFPVREKAYRDQVDIYAEAWARLTGEPVKERVLFFTAQDRMERW